MDNYIKSLDIKTIANGKIDIEKFIELYNTREVILLDVRYKFELDIWQIPFSLNIPLNELPDKLESLSKDKIIVCACPETCRSNIAKQYLSYKGYNAKILHGGLLQLMQRLKGPKSKDINV